MKGFRFVVSSLIAATLVISAGCSQGESERSTAPGSVDDSVAIEEVEESDADGTNTTTATEYRVLENAALPDPGTDPLEMILELRQPGEPIGSEQIRVSYPTIDQAVVVWVQRGLLDDSVQSTRTRYEFRKVEGSGVEQPLWEVVQVTQQHKCHAGRGSEEWTGELCL
ncbi:hypothetical protein [Egbenema bharatensis]|uniref:hypothetical protein n=1 Tax=Egbenema bharatensis TaxID=3463334 RepID=UPI003A87DA1B